ncbi:hypothetical protein [Deinococcus budaensis]|uniref:Holin n=1 Tax=Deinococcus budaensis TaxID=1665626 RepID=A0A7W8GFU7_9DEIO|nr:hypothetical protein [Deinococcus budaensis]MBB5234488.1 hypothetical protein [Deinococcus budaensis]
MEKALVIMVATALTASEASSSGLPLSQAEAWQLLFVFLAALATSLSNEAAKRREGDGFVLMRFWGDVGLGVMAGICVPLLITAVFEHFSSSTADWRASIGLSILGAYIGRDALGALWNGLLSLGQLAAKLKGINVSFTPPKPPDDEAPKEGGGPDAKP